LRAIEAAHQRTALADLLVGAVREAGALALTYFRAPLKSWTKGQGSPVSEADIAVDELLRRRLSTIAPDCGWLSEESRDAACLAAARVWIVDPIDGTRAFIAGRSDWSIAVALAERGRPVAAAIFAPAEPALFVAQQGAGATLNGSAIAATAGGDLAGARMAGPKRYLDRMARLVSGVDAVPKIHSLALRLARVAQGALDASFASSSSHDWDLAAADLLVHEAGGALTTLEGRPLIYNRADPVHGALVAAGHARHASIIELVRTQPDGFD